MKTFFDLISLEPKNNITFKLVLKKMKPLTDEEKRKNRIKEKIKEERATFKKIIKKDKQIYPQKIL